MDGYSVCVFEVSIDLHCDIIQLCQRVNNYFLTIYNMLISFHFPKQKLVKEKMIAFY